MRKSTAFSAWNPMKTAPEPSAQASVAVLHLPLFFSSFGFIFLMFGLPIFGKALGASAMEIGALYSVFTLAILVLRPVVGWALDRFGRKRFLVLALLSYALAMGLFASARTLGGLYAARLVEGIGAACLWTSARTIAADLSSSGGRGRAMGRLQEIFMRGGMVGALSGLLLVSVMPRRIAWRLAFAVFALLALFGAWRALRGVPETSAMSDPVRGRRRRWISRPMLTLLAVVFITGLSTAMLSPIYLIYLQDKFTTDIFTLGWAFFPAGIVASLLPSRLGKLGDDLGRAPLMTFGLIGTGILSLLLPHLPSIGWLMLLYALSAVGWSMAEPAEAAMVADLAGTDDRGAVFGWYEFVRTLGATLGPLAGGWLYDVIGKTAPFYLNGLVLCASALGIWLLLRQPAAHASSQPQSP